MAFELKLQHQLSLRSLVCWPSLQTSDLKAPTIERVNFLK